jgi:hypothetical protein
VQPATASPLHGSPRRGSCATWTPPSAGRCVPAARTPSSSWARSGWRHICALAGQGFGGGLIPISPLCKSLSRPQRPPLPPRTSLSRVVTLLHLHPCRSARCCARIFRSSSPACSPSSPHRAGESEFFPALSRTVTGPHHRQPPSPVSLCQIIRGHIFLATSHTTRSSSSDAYSPTRNN